MQPALFDVTHFTKNALPHDEAVGETVKTALNGSPKRLLVDKVSEWHSQNSNAIECVPFADSVISCVLAPSAGCQAVTL